MQTLVDALPEADREVLRQEFQLTEPTVWVTDLARRRRWQDANEAFLKHERERGRHDMEDLMTALGLSAPVSPSVAADLVTAAVNLYVADFDSEGCVERISDDCLRISIRNCPVFRRLEQNDWRGVTACGSWHRRHGWYDAMGIHATDSLLSESKWGDASCEALVDFQEPATEPLRRWSRPGSG